MSKTVWHPASEIPPLHEESFEDGSGQLKNVTHWAFPPELPEGVSHG